MEIQIYQINFSKLNLRAC